MNLSTTFFTICICSTFLIIPVTMETDSWNLAKRVVYNKKEKPVLHPKKRPFCNAFTGCGKKRSNLPALTNQGEEIEDSINSLLELSAEPAVEDLSRQIMSEAKLWEAIQEANVELNRRKQQLLEKLQDGNVLPLRSSTTSCVLPPCYI